MRATAIYTTALLLTSTVSAWNILEPAARLIERGAQLLEARQATTTSFNLSFSAQQGQVTTSSTTAQSTTQSQSTITGSAKSDASQSGSKTTGSATTTSNTQTVFDPRNGPGGISMITPNPVSAASYYKIKDFVTFGWNYTSCSILPSAIDILAVASNSAVHHTFTVALNQSVSGTTQAFTWDTGNYQATATDQLLTASYTLVVYDAAQDVSATAKAGYLGTWSGFYFAMYTPQPSVAFEGFQCVTCSAAMSSVEKQAMSVVFGVTAITILSFTWFAGAAGLF